jgi:hypothetical protein
VVCDDVAVEPLLLHAVVCDDVEVEPLLLHVLVVVCDDLQSLGVVVERQSLL